MTIAAVSEALAGFSGPEGFGNLDGAQRRAGGTAEFLDVVIQADSRKGLPLTVANLTG